MSSPSRRQTAAVFDVNETLLDLAPVRRAVNTLLLDESGASMWFSSLLHYSLVMTVAGRHADFSAIGAAVLQMHARNRDIVISVDEAREVLKPMRELQPHPDVEPALRRLKAAGFRLASLTNSSQAAAEAQLAHAGIAELFEQRFSVDSVQRFKPHADVYGWAASQLQLAPEDCLLVAAHGWDVAGAQWAGWQAAFIARREQQKFPLAPVPTFDVGDLNALADALGA